MILFRNTKIVYKFVLGFIAVIILVGSVSIYTDITSNEINKRLIYYADVLKDTEELIHYSHGSFILMYKYVLVENTAELEKLKPKIASMLYETHAVVGHLRTQNVSDYLLSTVDNYLQIAGKASQELTYSHDLKLGLELSDKKREEQVAKLREAERYNLALIQDAHFKIQEVILKIMEDANGDFVKAQYDAGQLRLISLFALTGGVILAFILSVFLSRIILKPVDKLKAVVEKIAEGDFDTRADVRSDDEIGYLALVFNQMLDKIGKFQAGLKEERDRIQAIVSSMGEGVFVVDKDQDIILLNQQAEKMLDLKSSEVEGKKLDSFFTVCKRNEELDKNAWPNTMALATGKSVLIGLDEDYYYKLKSGRKFPVTIAATPLLGNGVTGGVVVFRDVTDEKGIQQKIEQKVVERTRQFKEEQSRLKASINSINAGFFMVDLNLDIMMINIVAQRLLCSSPDHDHFKKKPAVDEYSDNYDCRMVDIEKEMQGVFDLRGQLRNCIDEKKSVKFGGLEFGNRFFNIFISPIMMAEQGLQVIGAVVLLEDITEAKMMERSKDEFFSIASHELRTPLTAIRGNISLIQQYYADSFKDSQFKEMIGSINDSTKRLISIVNDFLNVSRLEMRKLKFNNEQFDLVVLLRDIVREYATAAGSMNNLYVRMDEPKAVIPMVMADRDRVREVVINLIGNSIKFTKEGGVTIRLEHVDGLVKVSVADTGRGISEDGQRLLFRKFQQAGDSLYTRDSFKGTGLGLYISKMLVEGMGGKLVLDSSEVGKGSVFSFTLPVNFSENLKIHA